MGANTNNSSKKTDEPLQSCHGCAMTFSSGLDLRKHIDLAHKGRQAGPAAASTSAVQGEFSVQLQQYLIFEKKFD